jgi:CheY-like chemotaxis protein
MVVDDSLTVRRVTQRLLERNGYDVLLAKDGVDALRQLQDATPDVMLVDIEMPRMDGFDLTRNVRASEPPSVHPDHDDHLAHRRQAPRGGAAGRRERVPRQAVPGRRTGGADPPAPKTSWKA